MARLIRSRPNFRCPSTVPNLWVHSLDFTSPDDGEGQVEDPRRSLAFLADRQTAPVIQSGTEFGTEDVVSFGQNTSHFQRTFGPVRWAGMSLPPGRLEEAANA